VGPTGETDGADSDGPGDSPADSDDPADSDGPADSDADTAPPPPPALVFDGERPRNLIWISIDTLRRDYIGAYREEVLAGEEESHTPRLDALITEGVRLDNHRSCAARTYPSMSCAMSGAYGFELGFIPEGNEPYPEGIETIAQRLGAAGFATYLVGVQAFLDPGIDIIRGYDEVWAQVSGQAHELFAPALEAIDTLQAQDAPWFLHLHYLDPHSTYQPPPEYLVGEEDLPSIPVDLNLTLSYASLNDNWAVFDATTQANILAHIDLRYGGEVRFTDDSLERLLGALASRGALEGALVVLFSDHGEQFFEHGALEHNNSLHAQETHALAVFWADNLIPAAVSTPTAHPDLAPTSLEALGVAPGDGMTGRPAGTAGADRPIFSTRYRPDHVLQAAGRGDGWLNYDWSDGGFRYYRVDEDPDELADVYDPEDPEIAALQEALLSVTLAIEAATGVTPAAP